MLDQQKVESVKSFLRSCACVGIHDMGVNNIPTEVLDPCVKCLDNTDFDIFLEYNTLAEVITMFFFMGYLLKVEQDRFDLDRLYSQPVD